MDTTVAPYGSWSSPITAERIVAGAVGLGEVRVEGSSTWWSELRPEEQGRVQVVRLDAGGSPVDLLPEGCSARNRVHEYGGAAWSVHGGQLFFTNWTDQRLYRLGADGELRALTPEPATHHGLRYADLRLTPDSRFVIGVRERHGDGGGAATATGAAGSTGAAEPTGPTEVVNEIVALPADGSGTGERPIKVLVSGPDFVAAPRVSRDGRMLAWLAWNHPRMPWDGTELWIGHLVEEGDGLALRDGRRVAGGGDEALVQPEWGRHGQLYVVSDRGDWWNVYRVEDPDVLTPVGSVEADVGLPAWVFGQSRYGFTADGTVVFTFSSGGAARLAAARPGEPAQVVPLPFSSLSHLQVDGTTVTFVASAADHEPVVARLELNQLGPQGWSDDASPAPAATPAVEVLRPCRDLDLDPGLCSTAEAIAFPTSGGVEAHAYYYPPRNPAFTAPADERPPLVVLSHGGPTAAASPAYSLAVQYWTTRGFAVADVDYGGSSGYGRAYRERLRGTWGIVDVDDCCAAARALVDRGLADPQRLAIRGGSAGGFTTLAALTFRDLFRAGASLYGVADLAALARETHKFESRYLDGLVGPWPEAEAIYERRSPIHHTEGLSCPIILLQGLEDEIVPPGQAELMVEALQRKGLPHAYLAFEGEQHGFRRASSIVRALEAELYFYSRVFGFDLADPVEPVDIAFDERLAAPAVGEPAG